MKGEIWLEVGNVRLQNQIVAIQFKGDRTDREPEWWDVDLTGDDYKAKYQAIVDGLDKKRIVLANLVVDANQLKCKTIRIQYAESNSR